MEYIGAAVASSLTQEGRSEICRDLLAIKRGRVASMMSCLLVIVSRGNAKFAEFAYSRVLGSIEWPGCDDAIP